MFPVVSCLILPFATKLGSKMVARCSCGVLGGGHRMTKKKTGRRAEPSDVKLGEEYLGVFCATPGCGKPLPFQRIGPGEPMTVRDVDLTCPHCRERRLYPASQVRRFLAERKH